jgi:hypothetical protein
VQLIPESLIQIVKQVMGLCRILLKKKVYLEKFGRDSLIYWLKFKVARLSLKIDADFA